MNAPRSPSATGAGARAVQVGTDRPGKDSDPAGEADPSARRTSERRQAARAFDGDSDVSEIIGQFQWGVAPRAPVQGR